MVINQQFRGCTYANSCYASHHWDGPCGGTWNGKLNKLIQTHSTVPIYTLYGWVVFTVIKFTFEHRIHPNLAKRFYYIPLPLSVPLSGTIRKPVSICFII